MAIDLLSLIGTVVSGGATGLLGVVAGKLFDAWNKKQETQRLEKQWAHDLAMKREDREFMSQEWAQRTRVAEVEAAGRSDVAASEAFAKSYDLEPKSFAAGVKAPEGGKVATFVRGLGWIMLVLLDVVRGAVRPGLTIYLAYITTAMYAAAQAAMKAANGQEAVMAAVYQQIVYTLLYLFVTCVTWWFGVRMTQQPPKLGK